MTFPEHERGAPFSEEAYAQGKMLDHSSWLKGDRILPRRITPSDIDIPGIGMAIDNNGMVVFCELSRFHQTWSALRPGQRLLYENVIKGTRHCSVLCRHEVGLDRKIDSRHDLVLCQIMVHDFEITVFTPPKLTNKGWQDFVFEWMKSSQSATEMRRRILGYSAGMIRKPPGVVQLPHRVTG